MKKALPTRSMAIKLFTAFSFFLFMIIALTSDAQNCCPKFKLSIDENCQKGDSLCNRPNSTGGQPVQKASSCKGSTNTYSVYPNLPGYTYNWTVTGGTPLSFTGNPATITWGFGGNATIKVVIAQIGGGCRDSFEVDLCLKDGPIANFTGPDTVCSNQAVTFTNTSIGGAHYTWDFGDGTSYVGATPPAHTYTTAGTYIVTLLVSNNPSLGGTQPIRTDCYCRDIKKDTIIVKNGVGPVIQALGCYGSLCAKDTPLVTKYTTPTICGSYTWTINGGTITSGAGTANITVLWNPAFVGTPTVTLTVAASCSGGCAASTTIQVPIIYPNLPIQGANPVCVNSSNTYTLPTLPGCYYTWNVTGAGSFSFPTNRFNTTSVTVNAAAAPGTFTLSCVYFDSLKNCGGTATRTITVLPNFLITQATDKVCELSTGFYQASGNATWQVFKNGVLQAYTIPNGSTANITWLVPGTYQVVATSLTPTLYCNSSYTTNVVVIAKPVLTTSLALTNNICNGDIRVYQVSSTEPTFPYTWSISGGTILANDDDNVTVKWGPTGGTISVLQNNPDPFLVCPSNTITFTATPYALPTFTGATTACEDETKTYLAAPLGMPDYQWTVMGGTVISGQGSSSVQILWAGGTGAHSLTLTTCSGVSTQTVAVSSKVAYAITFNPGIACNPTLTSSALAASYTWYLNGTPLASTTQTIAISSSGYYTCLPNLPCTQASGIQVNLPAAPVVTISTPVNRFCVGTGGVIPAFNINSSISLGGSYTYQWYHFPSPGAIAAPFGTGPILSVPAGAPGAQLGTYYLVVSYGAGCTVQSNTILVDTACVSAPCALPPAPFTMSINATCGTNFLETYSSPPPAGTTISWTFGDGFTGTSLPGVGISHNYINPGVYYVCATASNPAFCPTQTCINDTVPLVPRFSINVNCTNALLTNTSQTLSGVAGYTVAWSTVGGSVSPLIGNSTTFTGTSGSVTMTVTYNGCPYTVTQAVVVPANTVAINSLPPSCVFDPNINTFSTTPGGFANYSWSFGDATTSSVSPTSHGYNTSSTFPISVSVVNYLGCSATNTSSILINPLPVVSLSTLDSFICQGNIATLTATAGFPSYVWRRKDFVTQTTSVVVGSGNTLTVSTAGLYTVEVTDINGCKKISNPIPIVVHPLPKFKVDFIDDYSSILCVGAFSGGFTRVSATYNASYSYLWSAALPISITSPASNVTDITVPVATPPGIYPLYIKVTNSQTGCFKIDSVCIIVRTAPSVSIAPASPFCEGVATLLTPTPNNPTLYDYKWSTTETTPTITVSANGWYDVKITDRQSGCTASSNGVQVNPKPNVSLFPLGCDTLCDTVHLYIPLANNTNPVAPYFLYPTIQWYVDGIPSVLGNFLNLSSLTLGSHVIKVEVTNQYGCMSTTSNYNIFVKHCVDTCQVKALFTYTTHNDSVYFTNASSGSGTLTYLWNFGDGTTSSLANPIHHFDSVTIHTVCLVTTNTMPSGEVCVDSFCICICACPQDSSCNAFLSYMQNKTILVNYTSDPTLVFSPPALLAGDIVRWDFTCDGIIDLVTLGNATATHNYGVAGSFVACARIERIVGGDTCYVQLTKYVRTTIKVACTCDATFTSNVNAGYATSVSGSSMSFVPLALTSCDTVEWNFGDGSPIVFSVGNTAVTHTYANPNQKYYVCMLVRRAGSPNCVLEVCKTLVISGVDEIAISDLKVYPNPTHSMLKIETGTQLLPENAKFIINDVTGRKIIEQTAQPGAMINYISTEEWSNGVYMLHIVNSKGNTLSKQRVVKW